MSRPMMGPNVQPLNRTTEAQAMSAASQLKQDLTDATVRVEEIIWIGGLQFECGTDATERLLESLPENADATLYKQLPALAEFLALDDYPSDDDIAEALMHVGGFLVQAARPVRSMTGKYPTFSWGYYATEWLYAENEAAIPTVLLEWAEAQSAAEKAKAA
jgi:hypothetical protein